MIISSSVFQSGPAQSDWPLYGLVDDVRPALAHMFARGETGALVTLIGVDGPSPRPLGAQMLIDPSGGALGYVSGGCVEGSIAILAQDVMKTGVAASFVFGTDSPFMDIKLICGTRIEVLIEPACPTDAGLIALLNAGRARQMCQRQTASDQNGTRFSQTYLPPYRLIVLGHDPVAIACVQLAKTVGFEAILVRDKGPRDVPDGLADHYYPSSARSALEELHLDPWTSVVTTTHDLDQDHEVLCRALRSSAFYVGALGSKRRLDDRLVKLRADGILPTQLDRLRAPVGLAIGAATPYEIGISIIADIIAARRAKAPLPENYDGAT